MIKFWMSRRDFSASSHGLRTVRVSEVGKKPWVDPARPGSTPIRTHPYVRVLSGSPENLKHAAMILRFSDSLFACVCGFHEHGATHRYWIRVVFLLAQSTSRLLRTHSVKFPYSAPFTDGRRSCAVQDSCQRCSTGWCRSIRNCSSLRIIKEVRQTARICMITYVGENSSACQCSSPRATSRNTLYLPIQITVRTIQSARWTLCWGRKSQFFTSPPSLCPSIRPSFDFCASFPSTDGFFALSHLPRRRGGQNWGGEGSPNPP